MMKKNSKIIPFAQRIPGFTKGVESLPVNYLILSPDFTIVNASDCYLNSTMTKLDDIIARNIFDAFPDNPDDPSPTGVATLKASLLRVLERQSMDILPLLKYDIPRPDYMGGGFEERFWNPVNFPVFDKAGRLVYIVHNAEDVTAQVAKTTPQMPNQGYC